MKIISGGTPNRERKKMVTSSEQDDFKLEEGDEFFEIANNNDRLK